MACEQAELERIWVAADGSVKALYADNSLLVLSSNGASFTRVSATGTKTVQLTECCLSRWKPLLAELLAFRNQHLDVPCFPTWLLKQLGDQHGLLFTTGYPVADTTWPATAEQAVEEGLVKLLDDQTIQLFSSCGSAYVTLQHTGLRFAVCYPLLLHHDAASSTYTYIQHTQVFSRSQYPSRWCHALAVATAAAQLAAQSSAQHNQQQLHAHAQQDILRLQQLHEPELLLLDVTNKLKLGSSASSPTRQTHSAAGIRSAGQHAGSCSSSPRHYGSPIQRQHKPWQDTDPLRPCDHLQQPLQQQRASQSAQQLCLSSPWGCAGSAALAQQAPAETSRFDTPLQVWRPPGSPGSPTAALYTVAEQHQQLLQAGQHRPYSPQSGAGRHGSSLECVAQLPIMPEVMQSLPQQLLQVQHTLHALPAGHSSSSGRAKSSRGSGAGGWNSHIAGALAEALGQRQQGSSSGADGACVGSWWLEPHLLLPADEMLHMIWTPDATFIFVEDICEVEVWLHADDSYLFSFQGGTFVTHLQPRAAAAAATQGSVRTSTEAAAVDPAARLTGVAGAGSDMSAEPSDAAHIFTAAAAAAAAVMSSSARTGAPSKHALMLSGNEGLLEGCVDASEVSRVYAASTMPPDLTVPALAADGTRDGGLVLPLGRIVTEALRLRSTMARVKASLVAATTASAAGSEASAPAACHSSSTGLQLQPARTARFGAKHGQHPQQLLQEPSRQQQRLSLDVLEDQDVPDVGRFTAYADGRVRVLFADRTILSLDADRSQAKLIMPDGSKQEVPVSRPLGVEEYVQAALEFATWSSHTPIQRAAALRMQALVAAELRSSARMAAICEWGSNPAQLPAAAAKANTSTLLLEAAGPAPLMLTAGPTVELRLPQQQQQEQQQQQQVWPTKIRFTEVAGLHSPMLETGPYTVACGPFAVEDLLQANRRLLDRL